jgi:hypothetical protein
MTEILRNILLYWRASLADGALGEGKFQRKELKRFLVVPKETLKTGILPLEVLDRLFKGQESARSVSVRFWPLVRRANPLTERLRLAGCRKLWRRS